MKPNWFTDLFEEVIIEHLPQPIRYKYYSRSWPRQNPTKRDLSVLMDEGRIHRRLRCMSDEQFDQYMKM